MFLNFHKFAVIASYHYLVQCKHKPTQGMKGREGSVEGVVISLRPVSNTGWPGNGLQI